MTADFLDLADMRLCCTQSRPPDSNPTMSMHVSTLNVEGYAWCKLLSVVHARDLEGRSLVQRQPTTCMVSA
jgi:hypothetical protein